MPTYNEWEVAACGGTGMAYPWGNEAGLVPERCVVNRWKPSFESSAELDLWDGYENLVHPARLPFEDDISPFGLLHMMGNVPEWTETPSQMDPSNSTINTEAHLVGGFGWNFDLDPGYSLQGVLEFRNISGTTGFRCAKSATPKRQLSQ